MTTEPQADIVERLLRPWFTNGCEAYQHEAAAEITRLRARLEVELGWPESADGIACRDETIRLQDAQIASLRAELAEARIQGRREGLEATQEVLGRVAYAIIEGSGGARAADHAREFVTANWEDAVRSARNVLTELRAIDPATLLKDADHG